MTTNLKPTNVEFVDHLLAGGMLSNGVYGILSPTGVGKSMLASQIAASSATGSSIFSAPLAQSKVWVIFDFHNRLCNTLPRIVSHVGRIGRSHVHKESEDILPYEIRRSADLPMHEGKILPSVQRRAEANRILNQRLVLITDDLSGDIGIVCEPKLDLLVSMIYLIAGQCNGLGGIVIDGARNVSNVTLDGDGKREQAFLNELVSKYCRGLANVFNCPVWITHQICGSQSNRLPAVRLSHRDAAGDKNFAESMDACLVLGNPAYYANESVFSIHCSKGTPSQVKQGHVLVKHDPDFSSIVRAPDYKLDRRTMSWKKTPKPNDIISQVDYEYIGKLLSGLKSDRSGYKDLEGG